MTKKLDVVIAGASGYTGGELLRLLLLHPAISEIVPLSSTHADKLVREVHLDLFWNTSLKFSQTQVINSDVLFLCLPHGKAKGWLQSVTISAHTKIIDLSADHRTEIDGFVYGLPELNRDKIRSAFRIANPGCFATAIQLALLPLAAAQKISAPIEISAVTGSSGAGQQLAAGVHFTWRNGNHSSYKEFEHQHEAEILQSLSQLQQSLDTDLHFIPQRGNFTRGIWATLHTSTNLSQAEADVLYQNYYATHPFTQISSAAIDLKQVVNTNYCLLNVSVKRGRILITSVIDNLLKGASGQALQNMNLLFDLPEMAGLQLKASAY